MALRAPESPTRYPRDAEGPAETRHEIGPNRGWLFLSGPGTWVIYFSVETVAESAGCGVGAGDVAMWAVLALFGLTLVVLGYQARIATAALGRDPAPTARAGFSIGLVLVGACLLLGLPALFSSPC
jgi:hypothetical protein